MPKYKPGVYFRLSRELQLLDFYKYKIVLKDKLYLSKRKSRAKALRHLQLQKHFRYGESNPGLHGESVM